MWDNKICLKFQHGLTLGLWSKNCPYANHFSIAISVRSVWYWGAILVKSKVCEVGEVKGCEVGEVGEVEGMRSRRSQRRVILASRFAGEVEGCDLGAIRSRSWTVKLKGAKSKGSGLWVHGVIWVWSLSLSLCMSLEMVWSENFHFKPFPGQTN